MEQNNYTELTGYVFNNMYRKLAQQIWTKHLLFALFKTNSSDKLEGHRKFQKLYDELHPERNPYIQIRRHTWRVS